MLNFRRHLMMQPPNNDNPIVTLNDNPILGKIVDGKVIYADYSKPLKINETTQVIQPKYEHFIEAGYVEIEEESIVKE